MKNMYASFKKSRWFPLVIGVLSIVFGILCLTNPAAKMETITLYIGLAIAAYGLFSCIVAILNRDNKKRLASNLILGITQAARRTPLWHRRRISVSFWQRSGSLLRYD